MLTCTCDSCGTQVPRHIVATVKVAFGRAESKFELCEPCQFAAVRFFEGQVGTEIMGVSREKWSEAERAQFITAGLEAVSA